MDCFFSKAFDSSCANYCAISFEHLCLDFDDFCIFSAYQHSSIGTTNDGYTLSLKAQAFTSLDKGTQPFVVCDG